MHELWKPLLLGAFMIAIPLGHAHADEPEQDSSFWMKKKLALSHDVLTGLATGDFEKIESASKTMSTLNRFERFGRRSTPGYTVQLDLFIYANKELAKNAREKNLKGATLSFHQLTNSCVDCHQRLRDGD